MAKYELRIRAREQRAKGESVREIAKRIGVSKSTVSLWVRDIILTVEQYERLRKSRIKGGERGRMLGAFMQKQRRLDLIERFNKEGILALKNLTEEQFFASGLALYWAEGSKKGRSVSVCNSDPNLMIFMIKWLETFFNIKKEEMVVAVGINEIHKSREVLVKNYWAEVTGLSLSQFRKTSFKKAKVHKVYDNYDTHYGTLRVMVLKPTRIYYRIMGFIEGLSMAGRRLASRDVS